MTDDTAFLIGLVLILLIAVASMVTLGFAMMPLKDMRFLFLIGVGGTIVAFGFCWLGSWLRSLL